MYVKTIVTLTSVDGSEDNYEVGAEVEPAYDNYGGREEQDGYTVGDPDFSAPGGLLASSRMSVDPQGGGVLEDGWAVIVEEALVEAYVGTIINRGRY